jgi:hypothetical protein
MYCSVAAHPFCMDGQTDRQRDKLKGKFLDFVAENVTKMENWNEPLWLNVHLLNYAQHITNFHLIIYTHWSNNFQYVLHSILRQLPVLYFLTQRIPLVELHSLFQQHTIVVTLISSITFSSCYTPWPKNIQQLLHSLGQQVCCTH